MNREIVNQISMQKELLTIEFRYHDQPKDVTNSVCRNKTITIGIFDSLEEAIEKGNRAFEMKLRNKGHEISNRCPKTGFQFN